MVSSPLSLLRQPTRHNPRSGFALLITVTLVAFLVLVLVALATLTRVETQVASNSQQVNQARQNALMALNIAIGQLQKYAGPDQRVTTTADITADKNKAGANTPDPVFTTDSPRLTVQPGSRYWTGVWGNNQTNIRYELRPNQIPPTTGNRRGVTPTLLNWLVSGNEKATFSAKGSLGGTNPGAGITYSPASTVDLSDLSAPTIAGKPAVILVGANSVGTAANANEDYVAAPLVDINAPAGATAGLGSTATPVVGKYAWWVGDEGVKARINLQNGYQKTGQTTDQINSFITAQRSAIEFMDLDPAGTANPTPIGTDYDFTNAAIPNIVTGSQLPLVNSDSTAQTHLSQAAQTRFHDITTHSFGVLSDTYAGGLKKDLTADIADSSIKKNNLYDNRPADTDPIFTPLSSTDINLPSWTHLRSWARVNPVNDVIDPSSPAARAAGIYPFIAGFSIGFDVFFDLTYEPGPPPPSVQVISSAAVKMAVMPFVVLHNPYPVTLKGINYDFVVSFNSQNLPLKPAQQLALQVDNGGDKNYEHLADIDLATLSITPPNTVGSQPSALRFKLVGEDILPGERQIYVLSDAADESVYSFDNPLTLQRAPASGTIGVTKAAYINGPILTHPNIQKSNSRMRLEGSIRTSNSAAIQEVSLNYLTASAVLAEENSIPSPAWGDILSKSDKWYQGITNIIPMFRRLAPGNGPLGTKMFFTKVGRISGVNSAGNTTTLNDTANTDSTGASIGDLLGDKGLFTAATGGFRILPVHDGHGYFWSSTYNVGINFVSGVRYIASASMRSPFMQTTRVEDEYLRPNGTVRDMADRAGAIVYGATFAGNTIDDAGNSPPYPVLGNTGYSTGFGASPDSGRDNPVILWDILDTKDRLLSLGQLQHVPFSRYAFEPSYLFGNSYADMRIARSTMYRSDAFVPHTKTGSTSGQALYDSAWLLNRAIWDKYFVSGVPAGFSDDDIKNRTALPDARMTLFQRKNQPAPLADVKYTNGQNKAYDRAASNLLVAGSFNINSTSEQAWRAILAGTYHIPLNTEYATTGDNVDQIIPYPRFTHNFNTSANGVYKAKTVTMSPFPIPTAAQIAANNVEDNFRENLFYGNRGLYLNCPGIPANTSPQTVVNELARSIVNEIRKRGPFLSMADFVNRPLTDGTVLDGIKGTLQAGIDNMNPDVAQVNTYTQARNSGGLTSIIGDRANGWTDRQYEWNDGEMNQHALGGFNSSNVQGLADTGDANIFKNEVYRARSAMAPKYITQADILSTLGPQLSPRSDTFIIRTYGETRNPVTNEPTGRAWCEAIVQRTPDYVNPINPPETPTTDATLNADNKTFGRAFKIVSFRWLTPDET